jgi:uncharacterized membrane protein/Mg-chelatase subunit ChlD
VIVVDRSRSMPKGAGDSIIELLRLAENQRQAGDRVGIVTFGARVAVERSPSDKAQFTEFSRRVHVDGTDIAAALDAALELIPEERAGSVLLLSDGELRGREVMPAVRRAYARGVPIDVKPFLRELANDLAVDRIELPEQLAVGEPFQFSAWIRSDANYDGRYVLERDGTVISQGTRSFRSGATRLLFRDVVREVGVARYRLHILDVNDRVPENNSGLAAVRVEGAPRLLVVNYDGQEDTLVLGLRLSGLQVDCFPPESAPLDRIGLERYSAVVLENVAANRISKHMTAIRRFVRERGGGLLMTGGQASFGIGGYYLSPLDELLPVSMELRKEQRKQGMALAIAMDISGSMGAPASGGTKMDLANAGAAAAIELLSPIDSVSVIAVDTAADVVQPLVPALDTGSLAARVLRIQPGGGGIYVLNALEAAVRELEGAPQLSKHITLFSDASDSEQQEGCVQLATQLVGAGVTISVIALGTPADSDADFLKRLALAGEGDCYFTTEATELPRLFALDTLNASRSTFVDSTTSVRVLSDLYALGEVPGESFPDLAGYNRTYIRESATLGLITTDDSSAPVFAFQYEGLGRTAAFTGQVGGTYGATVANWPEFSNWFVTISRWLIGQESLDSVYGTVFREGREAVIQVEVDSAKEFASDLSQMQALLGYRDSDAARRPLQRLSAGIFEARFPLDDDGIVLPTLQINPRQSVRLAPLALPYSPEFEALVSPDEGEQRLRKIAQGTGGSVSPAVTTLFRGDRSGGAWRGLTQELLLAALVLILLEILMRRLELWHNVGLPEWKRPESSSMATEFTPDETYLAPEERGKGASVAGHAKLADAMKRARSRANRETGQA